MKNGEKEGFDVNDVSAYLDQIQSWQDLLRTAATSAWKMDGIKDAERQELELAVRCAASVDHLAKVISGLPYTHEQAYALSKLLSIMGAAFIAGKYDSESPIAQKLLKDERVERMVRTRSGKRTEEGDEIICKEAQELYRRNSTRVGNESGTAKDILLKVNSERKKRGMEDTTDDAIRRRIDKLSKLGKLAR
jgi:hypothetical protein